MFCPACGKENPDATAFCMSCGTQLAAPTGAMATATGPAVTASPAAAPSASANAGAMAVSFLSALSLPEKIAGAGALVAIIGFFLPFIAIPGLGDLAALAMQQDPTSAASIPSSSLSLLGLGKFAGAVYFILIGALASAGVLWLARNAPYPRRMLLNGVQIMIGSMIGPGALLALLFASTVRSVAGVGFWVVGLGYSAIAVGGLMTIAQLSKERA
jgi:hypothetical protein